MSIPAQPWVIVPGNHDGVHLGHQHLLQSAIAQAQGQPVVPLFFDPHPAKVLRPEKAPEPLTTPMRRTELLLGRGASHVVCERFDEDLATQTPEAFATTFLRDKLGASLVVVGPDFRFGHRRAGDINVLKSLGEKHGFGVHTVNVERQDGERISSSLIRKRLKLGDVRGAAAWLGRFHEVEANVVVGQRRGRTLGFPTANLGAVQTLLPSDGVYAVVVRIAGEPKIWSGAANLGLRPTVGAGRSAEVHLLDFSGDADSLYGKQLRVGFVARIRDEKKFDGISMLKDQIAEDVAKARELADPARLDNEGLISWF